MKKFRSVLSLLLCVLLLCACGESKEPQDSKPGQTTQGTLPAEQTYSVTVLDFDGKPVSNGVVVNFISDEETAMQMVNDQGVAEKVLPTGEYWVELGFTDASVSHHYDQTDLKLTPERTALTIVLSRGLGEQSMRLNAFSEAKDAYREYEAHTIGIGSTYVPLDTTDRTYVLFIPEEAGLYEFSVMNGDAAIGYYGSEHFVLPNSAAELKEDGSFTINISKGMIGSNGTGTTVLVLGLDSAGAEECIVVIERIGDAELTLEDIPWEIYQNTSVLTPYQLPDNVTIRDFDLTSASDAYKLVKGSDGLYHLNTADGPVIYARLGTPSAYLDSLEDVLSAAGMFKYTFDDAGMCTCKESYTQPLKDYIACTDEASGLYPLTDDLIYMFQSHGGYVGWWDKESPSYLFEDANGDPIPGINEDIAWLFLCCYGGASPDDPCKNGHTEVTDPARKATCTEDGLTEGKHCSVCGKITVEQKKVSATGHSYGAWEQIKAPTAETAGIAERKCSACGKTEQKSLDKLNEVDSGPKKEVGKPANENAPVALGGAQALSFDATVKPGEYMIYHISRLTGVYLTIEDEFAYVVYGGKTYWPENGKISVLITNNSMYNPSVVWIGNFGTEERSIHVDLLYPLGDYENPQELPMGSFTTKIAKGNEQGYYYTYTATGAGTLTIKLSSVQSEGICSVVLYNLTSNAYVQMSGDTVSVDVKAGDVVQITFSLATDNYQFPGGTVIAEASLQ